MKCLLSAVHIALIGKTDAWWGNEEASHFTTRKYNVIHGNRLFTPENTSFKITTASHCQIIGTILSQKNLKKSKFYIFIYDSKMDKTHLQSLKNLQKNIFNVLEPNLDENFILKKVSKFTPKYRNVRYF